MIAGLRRAGVRPIAGGAGEPADLPVRWRCRDCGAHMRYRPPDAALWRRRQPLSSWMFAARR